MKIITVTNSTTEGTPDELKDYLREETEIEVQVPVPDSPVTWDREVEYEEEDNDELQLIGTLENEVAELREKLAIKHQIIRSQSQQIGSLQRGAATRSLPENERQAYIDQAAKLAREVETWKAIADNAARLVEAMASPLPYIITY